MAKLFYSLEEAADRLGKSEDEVQRMAETGQLQEFRDRDRLMFKVEQVDLLAGDHANEDTGAIPLADSAGLEGISLASESGSAMNFDAPKEQTGISIFDAEDTEDADPAAATMVTTATPQFGDPTASGSGLLDMTREADDTSLGADLLEDIYSGDTGGDTVGESAVGGGIGAGGALFEETGDAPEAAGPVTIITAQTLDSGWSGIAAGVSLGVLLIIALALGTLITTMIGAYEGSPFEQALNAIKGLPGGPAFATMYVGAGIVAIFAIVFGLIMKRR